MPGKNKDKDDDFEKTEAVPIKGAPGRKSFKIIPTEKKEFDSEEAERLR